MKFFHLSDFHLGKRVNGFSMLEDQQFILKQILTLVEQEQPDALLIAGDVYDKAVPPGEAVTLFDWFLTQLAHQGVEVMVISGNHDSPERLAFGARLVAGSGIHLSPVYDGTLEPVTLRDDDGDVQFYLLPFVKPAHVRRYYPDREIVTYTDAVKTALSAAQWNPGVRNVLVTHQCVTGASRSDSEDISVGGSDDVSPEVFRGFDYVALGHLHGPQNVGGGTIRYCGTPLKYSFSEAAHEKSVTVVELGRKGEPVSIRTLPLHPLRDLRKLRGTYAQLTARSSYEGTCTDDYLHITLTDENDVENAMQLLRTIYPNLMTLEYDNARTRETRTVTGAERVKERRPLELFGELYEIQNNVPMTEEQEKYLKQLIEEIWEGEI